MGLTGAEIVWTDASLTERGVADGMELDLVVGDTDDFEAVVPAGCAIARGSAIAIHGTEYGGIVDDISSTTSERRTRAMGRTWAGVLASRVIRPPAGEDYLVFDGDAHAVMAATISSCDLGYLFRVPAVPSGIRLSGRFDRYTDAATGLRKALKRAGARLAFSWDGSGVVLSCSPIASVEIDARTAPITIADSRPVNHLVLLGSGELADRLVRDVFADSDGNVSTSQSLFGKDLVEEVYELSGIDDAAELLAEGTERLVELQTLSPIEMSLDGISADLHVGDLVTAVDDVSGISATAEVSRAVIRVEGGRLSASYDTGPVSSSMRASGGGGSSGGGGGGGTYNYADLVNKPSIEGVVLVDDKTFSQLGLESLTNFEIEAMLTD